MCVSRTINGTDACASNWFVIGNYGKIIESAYDADAKVRMRFAFKCGRSRYNLQ